MTKLLSAVLLFFALLVAPAAAQWQVGNHALPVGNGAGVVGFSAISVGTDGRLLFDKGGSADPAFAAMSQDCTIVSTGAITCLKTNNVSFGALATVSPATGIATWLATSTSANLASAVTDETGSGALVFGTAPQISTIELGAASDTTIARSGAGAITVEGTDVLLSGGALGTPSSGTLTNATGLPIAGLTASTSTAIGVGSVELGHATDTTIARVSAGVASVEGSNILTAATGQPLDSDLTTIAGLTATTDNFIQSKSSAWASRTPAQVTADLSVMVGDTGSGGSKGLVPAPITGDSTKFLRGDATWQTIPGGGDALTSGNLSQFASTTSAQLATVISNETGTGLLVYDTSPVFTTDITVPNTGLHVLDSNASHDVILKPGSDVTADRTVTITTGDTDVGLDITDAGSDKLMFWDDSAGKWTALTLPPKLVISGTSLQSLEAWGCAVSDETTAITTGTAKCSWSFPYAVTVDGVYCTLNTVSSSGTPTFDINEDGTTIISTKVVIDVSEKTGGSSGYQGTAAGAAVISDSAIAAFAQITVDIDTAGTGAKGAKCMMIVHQ